MKKISGSTVIILLAIFLLSNLQGMASDKNGKSIELQVTFGMKSRTEREFDIVAKPSLKTQDGTTAKIDVAGKDEDIGFRMEAVPSMSKDNPELIIIKLKVWELRDVVREGKTQKEYVLFVDQTSKIKKGATMIAGERIYDRDIQVTITPNY